MTPNHLLSNCWNLESAFCLATNEISVTTKIIILFYGEKHPKVTFHSAEEGRNNIRVCSESLQDREELKAILLTSLSLSIHLRKQKASIS